MILRLPSVRVAPACSAGGGRPGRMGLSHLYDTAEPASPPNTIGVSMEILAYIPGEGLFVHVAEGTGDNLDSDDLEEGYVDYYMWSTYHMNAALELTEHDGGMCLLKSMCVDAFADAEAMLQDCMSEWLGIPDALYVVVEIHD